VDRVSPTAVKRWCAMLDISTADPVLAPQAFHWSLCPPETLTAELSPDGHPQSRDHDTAVFPRRMWASSNVEFLSPLPLDAKVERFSRVIEVKDKSGSSGMLRFVDIEHITQAEGREAVRELQTIVYREAPRQTPTRSSRSKERSDPTSWTWRRSLVLSEILLFRFSALTFNSHRIHYDYPYATQIEGYPALVAHSPLMATLLVDLCRRQLGDQPLTSFSFRAQSPAFAGTLLHLVGRIETGSISLAALDSDGGIVMTGNAIAGRP